MSIGDMLNKLTNGEIGYDKWVCCINNRGECYSKYQVGSEGDWYGLYDEDGELIEFDLREINSTWVIK